MGIGVLDAGYLLREYGVALRACGLARDGKRVGEIGERLE